MEARQHLLPAARRAARPPGRGGCSPSACARVGLDAAPEGFGAATDLAWYGERRLPGIICGPGSLAQCHVAGEYLETGSSCSRRRCTRRCSWPGARSGGQAVRQLLGLAILGALVTSAQAGPAATAPAAGGWRLLAHDRSRLAARTARLDRRDRRSLGAGGAVNREASGTPYSRPRAAVQPQAVCLVPRRVPTGTCVLRRRRLPRELVHEDVPKCSRLRGRRDRDALFLGGCERSPRLDLRPMNRGTRASGSRATLSWCFLIRQCVWFGQRRNCSRFRGTAPTMQVDRRASVIRRARPSGQPSRRPAPADRPEPDSHARTCLHT